MAGTHPTADQRHTRSRGPSINEQGLSDPRRRPRQNVPPAEEAETSALPGLPDLPPNLDPALQGYLLQMRENQERLAKENARLRTELAQQHEPGGGNKPKSSSPQQH